MLLVATAYADFTNPVNLSGPGRDAVGPDVATDADGDSIVAWTRPESRLFGQVQIRAVSPAGALEPVDTLSNNGFNVRVASDVDGDSIVAWHGLDGFRDQIHARTVSDTGVVGPLLRLSGRNSGEHQVATDADGDSIAVWRRSVPESDFSWIQARTVSSAGALGPLRKLTSEEGVAENPQVATDLDGDSLVVWQQVGNPSRIRARTVSLTGALGPIRPLSPQTGSSAHDPQVATEADGDSIVAWGRGGSVQARTVSAGGVRGPILTLPAPGNAGNSEHQVATDADGDSIAVWQRNEGLSDDDRIQARRISATSDLGPIQNLSDSVNNSQPQVAVDADGDAVVSWWQIPDASGLRRVQARTVSATGVRGPIQTLSSRGTGAPPGFDGPPVASDADGDAIVVWERLDGADTHRIQAALGP